jgi:hypothetical protein
MLVKYISSKQIVAQVLVDFNVQQTEYISRMWEWIGNALEIMELSNYFAFRNHIGEVENYQTRMPCDIKYLHSTWISGVTCPDATGLVKLNLRDNPLIGKQVKGMFHNREYGAIDGNYLTTTFRKGHVLFVYHGPPIDCDGYPLVPDDAKVKEALPFYIIYRLGLSGVKHPVLSVKEAYEMWEKLYPAAANSVNWMDLEGYQEFAEMWNGLIKKDAIKNFYLE